MVSTSQGFTIGTSPWDESCKQRRKAAATALNRPAVQTYMPIIDLESKVSIRELLNDSKNGQVDIDPISYFQRFALNTSLTLNYDQDFTKSRIGIYCRKFVMWKELLAISDLRATTGRIIFHY